VPHRGRRAASGRPGNLRPDHQPRPDQPRLRRRPHDQEGRRLRLDGDRLRHRREPRAGRRGAGAEESVDRHGDRRGARDPALDRGRRRSLAVRGQRSRRGGARGGDRRHEHHLRRDARRAPHRPDLDHRRRHRSRRNSQATPRARRGGRPRGSARSAVVPRPVARPEGGATLSRMRGAVAAGHPLTAEAGARVLAEGGNAVDACVAAAFAGAVAESPLTSPGAGGFMLVHRAADGVTRLADFFVAAPGLGLGRHRAGEMQVVDVGFGETTTQRFRIGPASCAVPGAVAGLEAAHKAFGRLPWRELLAPAIELARDGVQLSRPQAHLHALLDPILRASPEGRRVYSRANGERLGAGDTLRLPDLADTLDAIGRRGAAALYQGERAHAIVSTVREGGGEVTLEDLATYRAVWRRPVRARFRGHHFLSNPPPSSGGVLIAYGLALLERLPDSPAGSAQALAALGEVMREQERARGGSFWSDLHRGGLAGRLLAPEAVRAGVGRVRAGLRPALAAAAAPVGGT